MQEFQSCWEDPLIFSVGMNYTTCAISSPTSTSHSDNKDTQTFKKLDGYVFKKK